MTKRDTIAALQAQRDIAWQNYLSFAEQEKDKLTHFPEQANGRLLKEDVYSATFQGIVKGLDAAIRTVKEL